MSSVNILKPRSPRESTVFEVTRVNFEVYFEKRDENVVQLVDHTLGIDDSEPYHHVKECAYDILRNTKKKEVRDMDGDTIISIETSDKWSDTEGIFTDNDLERINGAIDYE